MKLLRQGVRWVVLDPAIPGWSGKANISESSQGSSDVRCENRNGIRKNRRTNQKGTAWVAYLTTIRDGQTWHARSKDGA